MPGEETTNPLNIKQNQENSVRNTNLQPIDSKEEKALPGTAASRLTLIRR